MKHPAGWVWLEAKLPAHLGGIEVAGYVPRKVRDGILGRLSHKQRALAAQWLRRNFLPQEARP